MYTQDKTNRITLRLNQDQFDYLKKSSDFLSVSPSEFLRMVINATMAMEQSGSLAKAFNKGIEANEALKREEEARRENETSSQYDKL